MKDIIKKKGMKLLLAGLMAVCMVVTSVIWQMPGMTVLAADLEIELCKDGDDSIRVENGTFTVKGSDNSEKGTVALNFDDADYMGNNVRNSVTDKTKPVVITMTSESSDLQGVVRTGGNNPAVPTPVVNGDVVVYTIDISGYDGNFIAFNVGFEDKNPGGGNQGGGNQGNDPQPGQQDPPRRTPLTGEVMSQIFTLSDGTNTATVNAELFDTKGNPFSEMTQEIKLRSEDEKLDFTKINTIKVESMTFYGNLLENENGNWFLRMYDKETVDVNGRPVTRPVLKHSIPVTGGGGVYQTADGKVTVTLIGAGYPEDDDVERTEISFTTYGKAIPANTDTAPFVFTDRSAEENFMKFSLEYKSYDIIKGDRGTEFANERFADVTDSDNADETAVVKAVPGYYFTGIRLLKSSYRGVSITTARVPSMYDFTSETTAALETTTADAPAEITVYYGEEAIEINSMPGSYDVWDVRALESLPEGAITVIPSEAYEQAQSGQTGGAPDMTWRVKVNSGYFDEIPLAITVRQFGSDVTEENQDLVGYVTVKRIGIDIVTGGEKSRDGKGYNPYHGAAQQGATLKDTETAKYSEAKNLIATFYYSDEHTYEDFNMVATLIFKDGTTEVRTVTGYGEADCAGPGGSNGLVGGDYLIWSSAVDKGEAPVSVSVLAVKAAAANQTGFSGAMFGNGTGVSGEVRFGGN